MPCASLTRLGGMDIEPEPPVSAITVVVRLHRDRDGRLVGFVERPRTGAKEPFEGLDAIVVAISKLLGTGPSGPASDPKPTS